MIPLLVGIGIGIVADELLSDDKKELQTSTDRKQVSASDVPEDIRRQIEGQTKNFQSNQEKKAKNWFRYANEYYYGLNGEKIDKNQAKKFFEMAANAGHYEAKKKLRELF